MTNTYSDYGIEREYDEITEPAEQAQSDEFTAKWEVECYGVTEAELEEAKPEFMSNNMEAMSWLSDAQHILAHAGDWKNESNQAKAKEDARQFINRAKYFIGKETKREREEMEN